MVIQVALSSMSDPNDLFNCISDHHARSLSHHHTCHIKAQASRTSGSDFSGRSSISELFPENKTSASCTRSRSRKMDGGISCFGEEKGGGSWDCRRGKRRRTVHQCILDLPDPVEDDGACRGMSVSSDSNSRHASDVRRMRGRSCLWAVLGLSA